MNKQSLSPGHVVLGGIVVGMIAAIAVVLVGPDDPPAEPAPAAAQAPATHASPQAAPEPPGLPADPQPVDPMPADRPPLTPEETMAEVLAHDKQLAAFMNYKKTVLLDAQRRDEYRKLLSDPRMLADIAAALMQPGSGPVAPEEHYRRLMQADYLDAAMTWKDNPQRDLVLATTGSVIARDNFRAEHPTDRKQLLAGGKMELYRMLYEQAPARADALVAQARSTAMAPLLAWMAQENQRRRTQEEAIRTEMAELQAKQ
jgi:hypothetical protein